MADEKRPRIFLRNPESGEPWAYIADLPLEKGDRQAILDFCSTEIEEMLGSGFDETNLTIEAKREMMTDAEVTALPQL